jgi:hypothetical protein
LNVWYLDDATLRDAPDKVLSDVQRMLDELSSLGLEVNSEKCELTVLHHLAHEELQTVSRFREVLPDVRVVGADQCTILGAPISDPGIPAALRDKWEDLQRMVSRLELIDSQLLFY